MTKSPHPDGIHAGVTGRHCYPDVCIKIESRHASPTLGDIARPPVCHQPVSPCSGVRLLLRQQTTPTTTTDSTAGTTEQQLGTRTTHAGQIARLMAAEPNDARRVWRCAWWWACANPNGGKTGSGRCASHDPTTNRNRTGNVTIGAPSRCAQTNERQAAAAAAA